jgi:multiple RNA-binding domain-containing protein 1
MNQLHNTFVDMTKIQVDYALPKKDNNLARPWSKYSDGSSSKARLENEKKMKQQKKAAAQNKNSVSEGRVDNFLGIDNNNNNSKDKKPKFWQNDDLMDGTADATTKQGQQKNENDMEDDEQDNNNIANSEISDMEYFKMKTDKSLTEDGTINETKHIEEIDEGRVYFTNLDSTTTEDELLDLCKKFGEISLVHIPIDSQSKKNKGYGYVLFMIPENADQAIRALDNSIFQGRVIHASMAKKLIPKQSHKAGFFKDLSNMTYKQKQLLAQKMKDAANGTHQNWNSTFMRSDAVAESIARQMGLSKRQLLLEESAQKNADTDMGLGAENAAVRLALAETELIRQATEEFLEHGVDLKSKKRSTKLILIKNFSLATVLENKKQLTGTITEKQIKDIEQELFQLFTSSGGQVEKVVVLKSGTHGLVEFHEPSEARKAFRMINLKKFHHVPLYLEWAPIVVQKRVKEEKKPEASIEEKEEPKAIAPTVLPESATLFVKNLNFSTTEKEVEDLFKPYKVRSVKIATRSDGKSRGFGFAEFSSLDAAAKAREKLQGHFLKEHKLVLEFSQLKSNTTTTTSQKSEEDKLNYEDEEGRTVTFKKLVVRNVAFEATQRDLYQLFSAFGEIKEVRLPRKVSGKNEHRGFAFIEFANRKDCHAAYEALKSSHLYGRTLKLEFAADETESLDLVKAKTKKRFHDQGLDEDQPTKKQRTQY